MAKIRIENLTFTYPLSEGEAVKNINLQVEKSQFVVLCGKSGCGKSTLLRHMKKQLAPYGKKEGGVYVDGTEIEKMDDRLSASKIGFISQSPESQIATDKVWHEMAFGLENLGMSRDVIKRRVAEMANYFGIQTWFRKDTSQLSGGQKQLLNLASVMVMQPEILILDEPTSQLDPIATTEFLNTLKKINEELGTTIVISEHRLEEVIPMADQVVVMDRGTVAAAGEITEVAKTLLGNGTDVHPMFYGMPSVMRIFHNLWEKKVPLTVKEGRLILEEILKDTEKENTETANTGDKVASPEAAPETVLEAKDLYFKYSRGEDFVLRGVNLKVGKSQWHCILGGNGAGKSTLLKAIAKAVKPQRGKVNIKEGCRVSMVPQNPQALFTEIKCNDELLEVVNHQKITAEEKSEKIADMLKLMEIEHLAEANPYDLSGGEQQRLAIGKVLLTEPDILLLDEPTKGLDPFFKISFAKIVEKLLEQGITVLMVSHDVEFCAEYCDQASMFFDGEIISTGDAKGFFAGNSFYTTSSNKLMRNWNEDIVTCEEARTWLREKVQK